MFLVGVMTKLDLNKSLFGQLDIFWFSRAIFESSITFTRHFCTNSYFLFYLNHCFYTRALLFRNRDFQFFSCMFCSCLLWFPFIAGKSLGSRKFFLPSSPKFSWTPSSPKRFSRVSFCNTTGISIFRAVTPLVTVSNCTLLQKINLVLMTKTRRKRRRIRRKQSNTNSFKIFKTATQCIEKITF